MYQCFTFKPPPPIPEDQFYLSDLSHEILGGGFYLNSNFLKDFQRKIFYFGNPFIIDMSQKIFAPAARQEGYEFLKGKSLRRG